jgi:hypothetical protein
MKLRVASIKIRQALDFSSLEALSDEDADEADDDGYLDGNQHYQDLRASTWQDVRYALAREENLTRTFLDAEHPDLAERDFYAARNLDDEQESLWGLDVGVAAAVVALNVLGARTSLSCNGGAFGGEHFRDMPCVRFFPGSASQNYLLKLAGQARVGLVEENGRALLYGRTIRDLQRFAAAALNGAAV